MFSSSKIYQFGNLDLEYVRSTAHYVFFNSYESGAPSKYYYEHDTTPKKFKIGSKNYNLITEKENDLEFINKLPSDLFDHMSTFLDEIDRPLKLQYFKDFDKIRSNPGLSFRPPLEDLRKKHWALVSTIDKPGFVKSHQWRYFKDLSFIHSNGVGDWINDLYDYLEGHPKLLPELSSISFRSMSSTEAKKYEKALNMFWFEISEYSDYGDFDIKDIETLDRIETTYKLY